MPTTSSASRCASRSAFTIPRLLGTHHRRALLIAACALHASALTAQGSPGQDAAAHYARRVRAVDLFANRSYVAAAATADSVLRADSTNGAMALLRAQALDRLGDRAGAAAGYVAALRQGFGDRPYQAYRAARLFAQQGDTLRAFAWLDSAFRARADGRRQVEGDTAWQRYRQVPHFRQIVATPPARWPGREAGWRHDLAFLVAEIKRLDANPARPAFTPAFDAQVARIAGHIRAWTDERIALECQRLVALLHSGHRHAFPATPFRALPLDLYWFTDGVFVVGAGVPALGGARVISLGGVPMDTIVARIRPLLSLDNPMMFRWTAPEYAMWTAYLRYAGAATPGDTVAVELERDGSRWVVRVAAVASWPTHKLQSPDSSRAPLYLRNVSANYWYQALPEADALYVQMNQVWPRRDLSVAALADSIRALARRAGARNLVVDVRHNNGGNAFVVRPLLRAMVAFEAEAPDHRLFVITSRNTFSAAQHFITWAEQGTRAIFVGEPSSSRPNYSGEDGDRVLLPFSGMSANISFRWHQNAPYQDGRDWIPVDVPAPLSAADFFALRDPAIEAIVALTAGGRVPPWPR